MTISTGGAVRVPFQISAADLAANVPQDFISPEDGFIDNVQAINEVAVVTGGTLTVQNWATGSAVVVTSLVTTVANASAKGAVATSVPAAKGQASKAVKKGQRFTVVLTGFAGGGALNGSINLTGMDSGGQGLGANGTGSVS